MEPLERDFWFGELEVMGARSFRGLNEGFYLAAKGGHNAESHNHNDIGNFIVYADGLPVLIDVGVETYTAKTFSGSRYEIWTMQSAFHNLPTINGQEFRAGDVRFEADNKKDSFSLDLSTAYPGEAEILSWERTITLNRGEDVVILDNYQLKEAREFLQMSLMSWFEPELEEEGKIRLEFPEKANSSKSHSIYYDKKTFKKDKFSLQIK